jgi:spermidine synthase
MIPWIQLDTASVPGDGAPLRLMQRGTEFSIMSGAFELMNNRLSGSEEALARLACERVGGRAAPRLLIGGLGMGFTLRAALADLGPTAEVVVAELIPAVVAWARGPLAEVFAGCLDDPRVTVREGDVGAMIRAGQGGYDAILLDVDNGPHGLSRAENNNLYSLAGLAAAQRALRPDGVLLVWSSAPDERFTQRLRKSGYTVEEVRVRASRTGKGARHLIWIATRPTG